jgi:hypothetical protein
MNFLSTLQNGAAYAQENAKKMMVYENPDSDDGGSDDSMDRERMKYIEKKKPEIDTVESQENEGTTAESGYLGSFLGTIK